MSATISRRAALVVAHSYDDFSVGPGQLDLRGDNSPPLLTRTDLPCTLTPEAVASYGEIAGDGRLRAVLAELFGVRAGQVLITAGGSEALLLALTCIADHGESVWLPRPAFPGFEELAGLLGLHVIGYDVPGTVPRRGAVPVLVCTPHNPTGLTYTPEDTGDGDGWVVWDLSHSTLVDGGAAEFGTRLGAHDVVVFSLSKLLRLPGARIGCLIARDDDLLAAAAAAKTHLSMSTNRPAQDLALHVLRDPLLPDELRLRTAYFAEMRTLILDAVAESSALTAVPAVAGTHVFVGTVDGGDAWQRLRAAGVVGIPGTVFKTSESWARLCVAQQHGVIDAAATRLRSLRLAPTR
ncbi:pyridoxal phosphate-dependent aminotransferase [Nocardia takedensis]|uniref:pyridoxal phosphate-dependent aminotransferase n=1 Tax=Nocardia takedensis TaxID=259390 RepID=UPI003F75CBB7